MSIKKTTTLGIATAVMLSSFVGVNAANATNELESTHTESIVASDEYSLSAPTAEIVVNGTNGISINNMSHEDINSQAWGVFENYTVNISNEDYGTNGKWTFDNNVEFENLLSDSEYEISIYYVTTFGKQSEVATYTVSTDAEPLTEPYVDVIDVDSTSFEVRPFGTYSTKFYGDITRWYITATEVNTGKYYNYSFGIWEQMSIEFLKPNTEYKITAQFITDKDFTSPIGETVVKTKALPSYDLGNVSISGNPVYGSTLTATNTGLRANSYQWLRNDVAIKGANKSTYKVSSEDVGKRISVKITGSSKDTVESSKTSPSKVAQAANLTGSVPTISGNVKVGSTVKVSTGKWTAGSKLTYQWLRDGKAIGKATGTSYKVTTADAGRKLTVRVTGSATGYKTLVKTSGSKTAPLLSLSSSTPKVTGSVKAGKTVKANVGKWTSGTSFNYQWYKNGKAIKNATKSSYKIAKSDVNSKISVKVTGKKSGYKTVSKTSKSTSKVKR